MGLKYAILSTTSGCAPLFIKMIPAILCAFVWSDSSFHMQGSIDVLQKYPVPDCDIWFIKFSCDFHFNQLAIGNTLYWNYYLQTYFCILLLCDCQQVSEDGRTCTHEKLIFIKNMLVANRLLVNELIYMHLIRVRWNWKSITLVVNHLLVNRQPQRRNLCVGCTDVPSWANYHVSLTKQVQLFPVSPPLHVVVVLAINLYVPACTHW